jgi:hypothetical protein
MAIRVQHLFVVLSILAPNIACTQEQPKQDPCDANPNLITCQETGEDETGGGETGDGQGSEICAPLKPGAYGESYECHGSGNGWLDLDIYPIGAQDPECLNWGDKGPPKHPTSKDCVPIDIRALPNGVPAPGACCSDEAYPEDITHQCSEDCAHAACKLAIAKLRDAALSLSTKGAEGVVRLDLFYLANLLESPDKFKLCVDQITKANGTLTAIELGAGASPNIEFGHVKSATLHLQCELDSQAPYALVGDACDTTPNMPTAEEEESSMSGLAAVGGVSITGPLGNLGASLHDISFAFAETPGATGPVKFRLEQFEAHASNVSVGSFAFIDPSVRLVAPAFGKPDGEMIWFPPGSLRMEVSAVIAIEGQPLFNGEPVSGEYVNTEWATATRSEDNEFAFIEATFETGSYRFVLDTEAGGFE